MTECRAVEESAMESAMEQGDGDQTGGVHADLPGDDQRRRQAIKQIERRRRFRIELAVSGIVMVAVVAIWAVSEYHNAGGWPSRGFSQSSGIHDVWNSWIIYPLIGWMIFVGTRAWFVYGNKPISETEISREMERQANKR
jgi:hypothetical protein